ncbi:MAG: tRNA (adenine(22)-N(1))-methyltransferase TrmK [Myxococcota bacterium]
MRTMPRKGKPLEVGLPGRLEAAISLIPETAVSVVDIGYDHGYALIELARRSSEIELFGVERIAGAARRFYSDPSAVPFLRRIRLLDGDGFAPVANHRFDAAIIAGMGEESIIAICQRHPDLRRCVERVVACSPQMPAILRPAFAELGYGVQDERLAYDGRRYYEVIAFHRDVEPSTDPLALLFGPHLLRDSRLEPYLTERRRHWEALLQRESARLVPRAEWPPPRPGHAGAFQRLKARALDAARRRMRGH